MAKPLDKDLRVRVVGAVKEGLSRHGAAARFGVSVASAVRWCKLEEETGSVAPKPMGGDRHSKLLEHRDFLLALVKAEPDLTTTEIRGRLAKRGIIVGHATVWRFFAKEKISFKKTLHAAEQDRPDVALARQALRERQPELPADKLVFVDETWTKTNMTRTHGRCPRGQRLIAKVPHGRWQTTTLIAAIRRSEVFAPMIVDGPVNAEVFTAYAEQCLAPALRPGEIVMVDHLSSHKGPAIAKAIADRRANLEFLPKYSPDLNPIEPAFGQIKAHLRKAARRTPEGLIAATASALRQIKAQHCANYFTAYGYHAT